MLGEAAEVVLASQRVLPNALQGAGFEWRYAELGDALRHAV
jgi:NAD dependent epimerase/dehydratase family enzyme